jgi:predicted acyl esterase
METAMIVPVRKKYKVVTEKNVPMKTRDEVTLYADVIHPKTEGRFPVLLSRTPYSKKGLDDPNGPYFLYAQYGCISVIQDCRERFGEGTKGVSAQQTVFHQDDMASYVLLPVIPR